MYKKYLNREDKLTVSILGSFATYLHSFAEQHKTNPKCKAAVKWARSAKTFTLKITDIYFCNLEPEQKRKIIDEVGRLQVVTKYKDEALRDYQKSQEIDSNMVLTNDDYYDLVEAVLEASCKGCSREPEGCKVKRIFVLHDVEPYNCEAEDCPFRY